MAWKGKKSSKSCSTSEGKGKKGHKDRPTTSVTTPELDGIMSGNMLNDSLIDATNKILHKQFPDVRGLQSPLLILVIHYHSSNRASVYSDASCWQ